MPDVDVDSIRSVLSATVARRALCFQTDVGRYFLKRHTDEGKVDELANQAAWLRTVIPNKNHDPRCRKFRFEERTTTTTATRGREATLSFAHTSGNQVI